MNQKRNVYALMIGIDDYPIPHHKLRGCVNDMRAVKEYIETRFDKENFNLHIKALENEQATRQNIIDGFLNHLTKATPQDIVFVHYSGHGSQEPAPEEFWHIEADKLNESMVCYDSRLPGGFDLVDKEQAYLLHKVAATGAHVVLLYDCCHSGSGTRAAEGEVRSRMAEVGNATRTLEQYVGWNEYNVVMEGGKRRATPPVGKHILLAAAKDNETAKETSFEGKQGGVFTNSLLHVLNHSKGNLSYSELMARVQTHVFNRVDEQHPQLEADGKEKQRSFLDGSILPKPDYYTANFEKAFKGWTIDAGAMLGIPAPDGGNYAEVALFDANATDKDLHDNTKALGTGKVTEVYPDKAIIEISGFAPSEKSSYKAKVTKLPVKKMAIFVDPAGEAAGVKTATEAIDNAKSLYIERVSDLKKANYRVLAKGDQFYVTLPSEDKPKFKRIDGYGADSGKTLVERLEHIAKWLKTFELSNPSTGLTGNEIEVTMTKITEFGQRLAVKAEEAIDASQPVTLEYEFSEANKKWSMPWFRMKLKNTSSETLYTSLLYLGADFSVNIDYLPVQELKPGEEAYIRTKLNIRGTAFETNAIPIAVPEEYSTWGITDVNELFKILISTVQFNTNHYRQEGLELDVKDDKATRVAVSDFDDFGGGFEDWTVKDIHVTTIRPLDSVELSSSGTVLPGVKISGPEGFGGMVNLASQKEATRAAGGQPVVPNALAGRTDVQDMAFNQATGKSSPMSVLEITGVKDASAVSSRSPISLELDQRIGEDEAIIPIAYDPELGLFLPVGSSEVGADGKAKIVIDQLPTPTPAGTRSLGGSVKILFKRVVLEKIGFKSDYPLLQEGVVSADGEQLEYKGGKDHVAKRVAESQRIVMFIHGIIGDTLDMTKSVAKGKIMIDGTEKKISDRYDLVLTFDYENLGTSIEDNGRLLKKRLEDVGLKAGHGKTFHIVAHSMGGLVSRWFIEKEGGNKVVSHLIQLGTPNGGSELGGTPRNWAKVAIAAAMGKVAIAGPFLTPLMGFLKTFTDSMLHTLGQMDPNSDFIKALNDGTDPGIPYSIIAGDTSKVERLWGGEFKDKLFKLVDNMKDVALSQMLFKSVNDIAVRVDSIKNVPDNRQFPPVKKDVACDHMSYFTTPEGLQVLTETLYEIETVDQVG